LPSRIDVNSATYPQKTPQVTRSEAQLLPEI